MVVLPLACTSVAVPVEPADGAPPAEQEILCGDSATAASAHLLRARTAYEAAVASAISGAGLTTITLDAARLPTMSWDVPDWSVLPDRPVLVGPPGTSRDSLRVRFAQATDATLYRMETHGVVTTTTYRVCGCGGGGGGAAPTQIRHAWTLPSGSTWGGVRTVEVAPSEVVELRFEGVMPDGSRCPRPS